MACCNVNDIESDHKIQSIELVKRIDALIGLRQSIAGGDCVGAIIAKGIEHVNAEPVEQQREADNTADATSAGAVSARFQIGQWNSLCVAIVTFKELATVRVESHLYLYYS